MVNENELREKMMVLETIKSQIGVVEEQREFVDGLIEDHEMAMKTVEGYTDQEDGEEMFIPVGGNAHVISKVKKSDRILVKLGANVSALTEIEKAGEIMEKRKKDLVQTKTSLESSLNRLAQEYQKLESEVQREYMELQSGMREG